MLSPDQAVTVGDPQGLRAQVQRICRTGKDNEVYYLTYEGIDIALDGRRAARLTLNGRQVYALQGGKNPFKGRGWLDGMMTAIVEGVNTLKDGGGDKVKKTVVEIFREEFARRENGGPRPEAEREVWIEWLEDDELEVAFGSQLFKSNLVSCRHELRRLPSLHTWLSNDEFDLAWKATSTANHLGSLSRLATARQALYEATKDSTA
jgi:hypothetical protein